MNYFKVLWELASLKRNEKKSPVRLRQLQERRLRELLVYAYRHSPYYRNTFEAAGITGETVQTAPLSAFPTLDKAGLLEHFDQLITIPDLTQRKPGRRGTTPAAIPPPLSAGVGKLLPTPLTGFLHMGLIHSQQIAEAAAICFSPLFSRQGRSTKCAFLRWQFLRRMRFVILFPPFDPADVTAEFPLTSRPPFRLKLFPAIRAYLIKPRPVSPFCQHFLVMVRYTALIAAEPPPSSWPAIFLFHYISARRANIYRYFIVPFGVVISMPAGVTTEFLPRDMARRDELFSAV